MKLTIHGQEYPILIVRKKIKNTYLRVKEDGTIYVTTSYFVRQKQIVSFLEHNTNFLEKALAKCQLQQERNQKFNYLGVSYDIMIVPTIDKLTIDGTSILIKKESDLTKFIKHQLPLLFGEELEKMYSCFKEEIPYPTLKIRTMKTRWGVCNKGKKTITLNSKLIEYPIAYLDYVIVHELSHFVHFNHSKAFWMEVAKYCPNYKEIRKSLRR